MVSGVESHYTKRHGLIAELTRARLFRSRKVDQVNFVVAGVQKAGTTAISTSNINRTRSRAATWPAFRVTGRIIQSIYTKAGWKNKRGPVARASCATLMCVLLPYLEE